MAMPTRGAKKIQGSLSRSSSSNDSSIMPRGVILAFTLFAVVATAYYGFYFAFLDSTLQHVTEAQKEQLQQHQLNQGQEQLNQAESGERNDAIALQISDTNKETLVLTTTEGVIKIVLRPDLSQESVDYMREMVKSGSCPRCTFYRAEKPGILQGIIKHPEIHIPTVKGSCPPEFEDVENDCPDWDKHCACHGPVMTRGMVAWAAGQTGPDFFIDAYKEKAVWWGTQHTVWGEIQDSDSLAVIDHIWTLPVNKGELTFLAQPIKFTMSLE